MSFDYKFILFIVTILLYIVEQRVEAFMTKKEPEPALRDCASDNDCNTVYSAGTPKNICTIAGKCACITGSGIHCQLGPNNYKNPAMMTDAEKAVFMKEYRPDFTVHDYTSWLLLFKDSRQRLPVLHLRNLQRLDAGQPVILPDDKVLPADFGITGLKNTGKPHIFATANDYFSAEYTSDSEVYTKKQGGLLFADEQKLLDSMQKRQLRRPRVSSMTNVTKDDYIPINYNEYPEYAPEQVTLDSSKSASDFVNNKIDAHELNYYIRPQVYPGDIEIEAGRRYIAELEEKILKKGETPESYHLRSGSNVFTR